MIDLKIIKRLCYEAGITIRTLSEQTKISQTAITMAIQRNSTTLETLEKIARYFRVSVGVFFGEKDSFNSIRKSFDKFNKDVQNAISYITTTLLYYKPELHDPVPKDVLLDALEDIPPEVAEILNFATNRIAENPTFDYLLQFSFDEIMQLRNDGIISKDTADFVLMKQNVDFFDSHNFMVKLEGENEPNLWYKIKSVIDKQNHNLTKQ